MKFEVVKEEFKEYKDVETILPGRATSFSAGYDFYSPIDVEIPSGEIVKIKTDVKCKLDTDEVLLLTVRSSVGIKKNLMLANTVGIIDSDYYENEENDGNIIVALYNYGKETEVIRRGERVVQGICVKYLTEKEDISLHEILKRTGGIGSTGEK